MKKLIFSLFFTTTMAFALVLTSCSNGDESSGSPREGTKLRFTAGFADMTRLVTDEDFKTVFETGDQIGIFAVRHKPGQSASLAASGNFIHNACITFDGSEWAPEEDIYLPFGDDEFDFYAYYPYWDNTGIDPTDMKLQVFQDQNVSENGYSHYSLSDILTAERKGISNANTAVSLEFAHRMALMQVEVLPEKGVQAFNDTFAVILKGVQIGMSLNLGDASAPAVGVGDPGDVIMARAEKNPVASKHTYRALVPAQTLAAADRFNFVQTTGKKFDITYTDDQSAVLKEGSVTRYEITLTGVKGLPEYTYKIGDYYPNPNVDLSDPAQKEGIMGVVFKIDPASSNDGGVTGTAGLIVSLQEEDTKVNAMENGVRWGAVGITGANDRHDGRKNTESMKKLIRGGSRNWYEFPAYYWVVNVVNGGNPDGMWYLPAISELQYLYCAFNGATPVDWEIGKEGAPATDMTARAAFNKILTDAGGKVLSDDLTGFYWTSREFYEESAYYMEFTFGGHTFGPRSYTCRVRPVAQFE